MASKDDILLSIRDLYVNFYTYAGVVKAINGVDLDIYRGEVFGLVGETGCGKSVTSRAITRLIEPPGRIEKGQILYKRNSEFVDLLKIPDSEIRKIRGDEISYIFQDPSSSLDPLYTSGYQIAETIVYHDRGDWDNAWRKAIELLKETLIPDPENRVKNYPHELSGGMRQRVVISIALSNDPKMLIADEPTTNVDVTIQAELMELLKELQRRKGTTILLITHHMGLIAEMADRVGVMYAGNLVEIAPIEELFEEPLHPYTKGLLAAVPNPLEKIDRLKPIKGVVPNLIFPPEGCRFHPRCPYAMDICKTKPPRREVSKGHFVECWLYADKGNREEVGKDE